jgi:hypothetical protein
MLRLESRLATCELSLSGRRAAQALPPRSRCIFPLALLLTIPIPSSITALPQSVTTSDFLHSKASQHHCYILHLHLHLHLPIQHPSPNKKTCSVITTLTRPRAPVRTERCASVGSRDPIPCHSGWALLCFALPLRFACTLSLGLADQA